MVGATAMRQVKLWVQGSEEGSAQIEYWRLDRPNETQRTKPQAMRDESDHIAQFVIGGLEPGQRYGYRVLMDGKVQMVPESLQFATQALWQWRGDPPAWKLVFGSCNYGNEVAYDRPGRAYGGTAEMRRIFASMAQQSPDLTLWGGDYLYFREPDEDSEFGLRYRWRKDRAMSEQQVLLRTGSHVSIWDDHEYGPNDSNASYILKGSALELFKRYWANPGYGLPETPGTFSNYRFNDAELFLLDNRYYRDSDKLQAEDKSKLGAAQFRWLQNALLASVSPVKLIVLGSQVTNEVNRFEGWNRFPRERDAFLKFLQDHRIDGVILLTGDRHFTELLKTERPGSYPLYELTCSPLLSGVPANLDAERANKKIVDGTFVAERNFCTISFEGTRMDRKLTLRSHGVDGMVHWQKTIAVNELRAPPAK